MNLFTKKAKIMLFITQKVILIDLSSIKDKE